MEEYSVLQIDIAGNRYQLDAHQENLIPVDRNLAKIPIGNLDVAMEHEWQRIGYYDLINRCLYEVPEDLRALPENVIGFSIPSHHDLLESVHTTLVIYAEVVDLRETELSMKVWENSSDVGMEKEPIDYQRMIVIHGTLYAFDKINDRLAVHGNKQNYTNPEHLDWQQDHVTGYYNRESKELVGHKLYLDLRIDDNEFLWFYIPMSIMNHDQRQLLTKEQIQKFNDESLERQYGFCLVDAALSKRLSGELPEIQFDGITYTVDLQNLQISQKEKPEIKFELRDMDFIDYGDFLYNTSTKTPSRIDPQMSAMPDDTIAIRLFDIAKNDVIGYAQFMKYAPTAFLSRSAWQQPDFKAEVVPLHATKIPELIRRNQMEKEEYKTKRTETQQPQRKKGRRL